MRCAEPRAFDRKNLAKPDRDRCIPNSQLDAVRRGERRIGTVVRKSNHVSDEQRSLESVPDHSDGDILDRPDSTCDDFAL